MIKKWILLNSIILIANGLPSHKENNFNVADKSRKGDPLPNGAQIPDNSSFLDKYEQEDGDIIKGQYSYFDPRGSLVVVRYTLNRDGSNYSEKRLLTVDYKSEVKEETSEQPLALQNLTENDLVEKIIAQLRPTIAKMVDGKTPVEIKEENKPSFFEYFVGKIEKAQDVTSQIICDLMSANADAKNAETENELISGIIFKVFALLPEGTLLTYAKKLSRHIRDVEQITPTIQPIEEETTTFTPETTTIPVQFDNFLSSFIIKLFAANNSTNFFNKDNATETEEDEVSETNNSTPGFLSGLMTGIFAADAEDSTDDPGFLEIFKQVLAADSNGPLGQVVDLLTDVESLFSLYIREASCLSVPGRNKQHKKSEDEMTYKEEENEKLVEESTMPSEDENNSANQIEEQEIRDSIKETVARMVIKSSSSNPSDDENLIEGILKEVKSKSSNVIFDSDFANGIGAKMRPYVIEEIHNRRLDLYKKQVLKNWPQKTVQSKS